MNTRACQLLAQRWQRKWMTVTQLKRKNEEVRRPQRSTLSECPCLGRRREVGRERQRHRATTRKSIPGPREECSMEVERPMVKLGRCSWKGLSQRILHKPSYSNAPWECLFKGSFQWICLRRGYSVFFKIGVGPEFAWREARLCIVSLLPLPLRSFFCGSVGKWCCVICVG